MNKLGTALLLISVILFFMEGATFAGSSQAGGEIYFEAEEIIAFSKKVERELAQSGARVAIIARVGRPREKLPEGINYTHTGFAVYSKITTSDGRKIPGYAIYNLYQDAEKSNTSNLVQDYMVDFFAAVQVLEAGVIIPSPELQKRLLSVLSSPVYEELHNPQYSVIANPFTVDFQNCTEHVLDNIVAAIYNTSNLMVIKANEKAYFEPQTVNVNPLKLLLGGMFVKDVSLADQTTSNVPITSTFSSIQRFLTKYNAVTDILTITPDS